MPKIIICLNFQYQSLFIYLAKTQSLFESLIDEGNEADHVSEVKTPLTNPDTIPEGMTKSL